MKNINSTLTKFNLKLSSVESNKHDFSGKFLSDKVGIYFIYEFRESVPLIQISLLTTFDIKLRPGLYTLIEMYKDPKFVMQSFYLDEILSYKDIIYRDYFKNAKSIEDCIDISSELIKAYAVDFVSGNLSSYSALNDWLKIKVNNHIIS